MIEKANKYHLHPNKQQKIQMAKRLFTSAGKAN